MNSLTKELPRNERTEQMMTERSVSGVKGRMKRGSEVVKEKVKEDFNETLLIFF